MGRREIRRVADTSSAGRLALTYSSRNQEVLHTGDPNDHIIANSLFERRNHMSV
jgi:hypothetical protein